MSSRAGQVWKPRRLSGTDGDRERQRPAATPALSASRPQVRALQALQQRVDGSQRAAELRGLQAISHNNAGVIQGVRWQDMANRSFAAHADAEGLNSGPAGLALQRQKANGWYRMKSSGNLRNDDATHTVVRPLPKNTVVKVVDNGGKVSNFKAGLFLTNEHSWAKIPLQNEDGWIEDGKLDATAKSGVLPHDQFLNAIGAGRTDYHFGLNGAGAANPLGPRMDYVDEIEAGTVAEYDWGTGGGLPAHIMPGDHARLAGAVNQGQNIAPMYGAMDPVRIAAATFKDPMTAAPVVPAYGTKYEEYTWYRKAMNSGQAHNQIETNVDYSTHVHPGVDFSKSALIDQLVQHKHIHFHVSGMQSLWNGVAAADMTGADFQEVLHKAGNYAAVGGAFGAQGGDMKDDVTFRELRFIWRYWNRNLIMPDNTGVPQAYQFQGNVTFYCNGTKVKPPWQWRAGDTGASPASRA